MTSTLQTPRTTVRRLPKRGVYDREAVHAILDEALFCHLGFVSEGQPFVLPTIHARIGDVLYVHGSAASRMLAVGAAGAPLCVTVTLLDGLVLARSAFHHSMNYRSAMVVGQALAVDDPEEKETALTAIVEHVAAGRSAEVRAPNALELKATRVLRLPIEEASAKVRTGPPVDDEEDYALPVWAGELPLALRPLAPRPDPRIIPGTALSPSVEAAARRGRSDG
jgi:uncharacterized protein